MKSKVFSGILFAFVLVFIVNRVQRYDTLTKMGNILSTIPSVDKIVVRDVDLQEDNFILTKEDDLFNGTRDVYTFYHPLNWYEKKLLRNDPIFELEYLIDGQNQFTAFTHHIDEEDLSMLPDDADTIRGTYSFKHSPTGSDDILILSIDGLNHLAVFTNEMKDLIALLVQQDV